MSKWSKTATPINTFIFMILTLISTQAFAKPYTGDFEVELNYTTKLSVTEKFTLQRKNKQILLNGIILPAEKILVAQKQMSYLVMNEHKPKTELSCPAGQYTLTKTLIGKPKIETGCIGTDRFTNLVTAFKSI